MIQVYLDDVTPTNGSLQCVPGSHVDGLIEHQKIKGTKLHLSDDVMARFAAPVEIQAKAGDVVLMSHHVIHGSGPNRSESARRAVRITYVGKLA